MDTSIVEITSRKRKRNEEMEEVEETTFVVVSLVTMLLGVMSWYYDKYFVKEPVRNWELERRIFLNQLYRGTETITGVRNIGLRCRQLRWKAKRKSYNFYVEAKDQFGGKMCRIIASMFKTLCILTIYDPNLCFRPNCFEACFSLHFK